MPLPPLTTERLLLRQRHLDDVAAIIRMNSDPEIMRFVGDGRMSDPVELEKRTRERVGTDFGVGLGYWSVFPRERPDDYLGYVVLSPVVESDRYRIVLWHPAERLGARLRHRSLQGRTGVSVSGSVDCRKSWR